MDVLIVFGIIGKIALLVTWVVMPFLNPGTYGRLETEYLSLSACESFTHCYKLLYHQIA